ncbi:unnamed protein product, partial [Arabidopsis halleri]
KKKPLKSSPPKVSIPSHQLSDVARSLLPSVAAVGSVLPVEPVSTDSHTIPQSIAQSTVLVTDLANSISDLKTPKVSSYLISQGASASATKVAISGPFVMPVEPAAAEVTSHLPSPAVVIANTKATDTKTAHIHDEQSLWVDLVKGTAKPLQKRSYGFTLPYGEVCVRIPNSIIEKNKKVWECFILGQVYSDPPSHGTLHNIVNGVWSRSYRDVTMSKMKGNAFLFRIPNAATRAHVINQNLWQIEGHTMFVAKWEPGVVPMKPQLTSAPIWLELRQTNLEVAKVFTIIDPRKPLPEAVNVQFDSGEINRVLVSSPWMPHVCEHCKEIGHSRKRCKLALVLCKACNSIGHDADRCRRKNTAPPKKRYQTKPMSKGPSLGHRPGKEVMQQMVYLPKAVQQDTKSQNLTKVVGLAGFEKGSGSGVELTLQASVKLPSKGRSSEAEEDSSDILSTEFEDTASLEGIDSQGEDYSGYEECVIASNDEKVGDDLWKEIVDVANCSSVDGRPWLVLGDFNQTLNPAEHSSPVTLNGKHFYMVNKSKTLPVAKKLDRVLTNEQWSLPYPESYALFGDPDFSNHASAGVALQLDFYKCSMKLKLLKNEIRTFRKDNFSYLEKRLTQGDMELLLPFRCNPDQKDKIEMRFTNAEIQEAFFSLPKNKSCGLDGYLARVWFSGCSIVPGIGTVSEFFQSDTLLKQWNATTLVLIPKSSNASKASEFRSISCLNTIYKVISKLLAKRLQQILSTVVSSSQSAFRSNSCLNTIYKVISKLLAKRLQQILSTVVSSSQSAFMPRRLLGENVLLATEIVHGSSLHGITEALDDFATWSRLYMNRDKTQLFCAGQNHLESAALASFGFLVGSLPIRYLGLPLMHRKLRISDFWSIKESARNSWMWNSLLKLRPLAEKFLRSIVGNGNNTSFWCDLWILLGPIIKLLGSTCPRALRLPLNSTMADACSDLGWSLPAPRSDEALALHIHLTSIQLPKNDLFEDYYCWVTDGYKASSFSSAKLGRFGAWFYQD